MAWPHYATASGRRNSVAFTVFPDPIKGIGEALSRARRGRYKRNVTHDALEWWGWKIGRLDEKEKLRKKRFKEWRRGYGQAEVGRIVREYHRWFKRSMGG